MKTKVLSLVALFMLGAVSVSAGNKNEKIEVKGNCGMCESRIEKAAKSVDGVSKADWNKETKQLEVVFDDTKTNLDKIEVAIAKVGHDTPKHKAPDAVYKELRIVAYIVNKPFHLFLLDPMILFIGFFFVWNPF